MATRSQPAPPPLTEAVRAIYLEHRSGVLEIAGEGDDAPEQEGGKRRLFFVDGELHLPPVHALAKKLAPHLPLWPDRPARSGAGAAPSAWLTGAKGEVKQLMVRIAGLLAAWQHSPYAFYEGPQTLPPDLVGPLPTVFLLMEWAVAGRTDVELLAELGGPGAQLVAVGGAVSPAVAAALEPQETLLASRLAEAATVGELLRQTGKDSAAVLRRLCRLRAVGLIRYRREPVAQRGALVAADILRQFSDRVERGLALHPVDLEPDAHRAYLADFLARAGAMNHYELLGVHAQATGEEVHDAYDRLARLVHPGHTDRLKLGGREGALWLLFERATDAYLTLTSPERRRRYEARVGAGHDPLPSQDVREKEAERLARRYYERGVDLLEQEDFHFAVELLRQAAQTHPRPEYYLRLAEAQAQNPNWARQAADSYRKVIDLGGDRAAVRAALGQLCETLGRPEEARHHYETALAQMPGEPEAQEGLARVAAVARPAMKRRRSWLDVLLRR